jgi:hypothetical protein
MALSDYVTLNITQTTANLTRAGFGIAMHLSYTPTWSERSRTYTQFTDVVTDFPIATGPEQRMALAYFSQSPSPTALIIGRGANKPTKTVQISAISPDRELDLHLQAERQGHGIRRHNRVVHQ